MKNEKDFGGMPSLLAAFLGGARAAARKLIEA